MRFPRSAAQTLTSLSDLHLSMSRFFVNGASAARLDDRGPPRAVRKSRMSSMTRLAPRRFAGLTMGAWFASISLGNLIAGIVGGNVDPEKLAEMPALFQRTAMSLFVAAALLLALVVPIRRLMERTNR